MSSYPKPSWRPKVVPTIEWTIQKLQAYLSGKQFAIFKNGTCVVWPDSQLLGEDACKDLLLAAVKDRPDFKVRRHSSGDFLVTFKGGVGGLMSGDILRENFDVLRDEALTEGRLSSESFRVDDAVDEDEGYLVAGLYVRARLYLDAESPSIVYSSSQLMR